MKKVNLILAFIIILSSNVTFAQKVKVNTEESSIEWLGKKIGGDHNGHIQIKSGSIELQNDKIEAAHFVVDMTTITNTDIEDKKYNDKLVGHLKSEDFFGVEKYPTAKFILTQSSKFEMGKATITGDFTIKDKTESITFEIERVGNEYTGKIEIDRSKFDVRYGSNSFFDNLGDKAINDIFILDIKLILI